MADSLSAPDYIRANFQPPDRIPILLRSRMSEAIVATVRAQVMLRTSARKGATWDARSTGRMGGALKALRFDATQEAMLAGE